MKCVKLTYDKIPQEFLDKVLEKAEKQSELSNGIKKISPTKLKWIISSTRLNSKIVDSDERKKVIKKMQDENSIRYLANHLVAIYKP